MPHRNGIATSAGPPARTVLAGGGEVHMQNACLSALSSRALSLLGSHLREAIFRAGSILWPVTTPLSEVYFPSSGLISILVPVSDGALIEVGSICRQAAVGAIFDPSPSHTQGVVEIRGECTCPSPQKMFSSPSRKSANTDPVDSFRSVTR